MGGAVNTGFSYGLYALLLLFGSTYLIANLIAAVIGTLFSFYVSKSFVFRRGSWRYYGRFLAAWIFIWGVGSLSLIAFIEGLMLSPLMGGIAVLPITTGIGYLAQRFYVFRESSKLGT